MSHLLNPIIERADPTWQEDGRGSWYLPTTYFVSCSCGWYYLNRSKSEAEDTWVYHIKHLRSLTSHLEDPGQLPENVND